MTAIRSRSFNPRPVARPGEPFALSVAHRVAAWFQSTPGRSTGRTGERFDDASAELSFNPRPVARPGEPRAPGDTRCPAVEFQSTPGRSTGRTAMPVAERTAKRMFQSTPGRSTGRTEMRTPLVAGCFLFQSTPGRSTGRTGCRGNGGNLRWNVSIHARSLDRANLFRPNTPGDPYEFQSTPGRSTGRTLRELLGAMPRKPKRFNPRPVARPGEPQYPADLGGPWQVSIHARSLDRANPSFARASAIVAEVSIHARSLDRANLGLVKPLAKVFPVSIHARSLDRANPFTSAWHEKPHAFQSTPGRSTGRTLDRGRRLRGRSEVSIHARSLDRANLRSILPGG